MTVVIGTSGAIALLALNPAAVKTCRNPAQRIEFWVGQSNP
jgi:hypothetical protein